MNPGKYFRFGFGALCLQAYFASGYIVTALLQDPVSYTRLDGYKRKVYGARMEKGWSAESLPTVRTISNILIRQEYRLRTVAKTKVQKKQQKPTPSLKMSGT